jgi:predicted O-methyltransferase YrrM
MSLKQTIKKLIPNFIKKKLSVYRDIEQQKRYNKIKRIPCNTSNLLESKEISLENIFKNDEVINSWNKWQDKLDSFVIPDFTGGVNQGDRKAIFFLIRFFKPKSVLEIGTHIGASTVNIAAALNLNRTEFRIKPTFRTLDIRNVNSASEKPWLEFGTDKSPLEMIKNIKCESFVEFITDTSFNYFEKTTETYDFIFLDGDHSAKTVYKEIPLALNRLNKGGVILLHDYFPNGKPLWSNNSVLHGPYLATERLIKEGAEIVILPLGGLPWKTKLNSNVTSLALCLKN